MAIRPVFCIYNRIPYVKVVSIEFTFHSGFAVSQKQKSYLSLQTNYLEKHPDSNILEISSKSMESLGVELSAFNLMIKTNQREFSVESAFQSSKVFEKGGPYTDILDKNAREAKKDIRLKNSGKLISFQYFGRQYPLEPKDYFYNWLYINSLYLNKPLMQQIVKYNSFTDIEFNPDKSINCQAKAIALFVSLYKEDLLEESLKSQENFLQIAYGIKTNKENKMAFEQIDINSLYKK